MIQTAKCRISVVKRSVNPDIIDRYMKKGMKNKEPCSKVNLGDEFLVFSEFHMPENFCHWAWADIRHDVMAVINGARFPWFEEGGMTISGCTDWFKPVLFKIEKL